MTQANMATTESELKPGKTREEIFEHSTLIEKFGELVIGQEEAREKLSGIIESVMERREARQQLAAKVFDDLQGGVLEELEAAGGTTEEVGAGLLRQRAQVLRKLTTKYRHTTTWLMPVSPVTISFVMALSRALRSCT